MFVAGYVPNTSRQQANLVLHGFHLIKKALEISVEVSYCHFSQPHVGILLFIRAVSLGILDVNASNVLASTALTWRLPIAFNLATFAFIALRLLVGGCQLPSPNSPGFRNVLAAFLPRAAIVQ
jgi:hypothetical protein